MTTTYIYYGDELYHHGVKGQKWGTRRYQNADGSLTPEGRIHYGYTNALSTVSNVGHKVGNRWRTGATIRSHGRIASTIQNYGASGAKRVAYTADELKKIADSDDSFLKKALRSASYGGVRTVAKAATDAATGGATTATPVWHLGSGAKYVKNKAQSEYYDAASKYGSTKTGRYLASIGSKNAAAMAEYYKNRVDSDSVKEYLHNTLKIFSVPMTRATGKQSTMGKEILRAFAGLQVVDLARVLVTKKGVKDFDDSQNWRNQRKARKAEYKKAVNASYDRIDKAERDIEAPYKRGQSLSEHDYNRQQKVYDDERKAREAAKRKYKYGY